MIIQINEEYKEGQMEDKLLENPFNPAISLHSDNINLKTVALGSLFSDGPWAEVLN